jgi:hypothetical protein
MITDMIKQVYRGMYQVVVELRKYLAMDLPTTQRRFGGGDRRFGDELEISRIMFPSDQSLFTDDMVFGNTLNLISSYLTSKPATRTVDEDLYAKHHLLHGVSKSRLNQTVVCLLGYKARIEEHFERVLVMPNLRAYSPVVLCLRSLPYLIIEI